MIPVSEQLEAVTVANNYAVDVRCFGEHRLSAGRLRVSGAHITYFSS